MSRGAWPRSARPSATFRPRAPSGGWPGAPASAASWATATPPSPPSFFYRVHGPEVAQLAAQFGMKKGAFIGVSLGLVAGVAGAIGSWTGGQIADRCGAKDLRVFASVPALAVILSFPFTLMIYTTGNTALAL